MDGKGQGKGMGCGKGREWRVGEECGKRGKGGTGFGEWMGTDLGSGRREILGGDGRKGREGWDVGRGCLWG